MIKLSQKTEFEKLQTKRATLEAESHSLKEEQKNLEDNVKILEERIVIEELSNTNKAARDAISQLDAKRKELETKLKQVAQTSETLPPPEEAPQEVVNNAEKPEDALEPAEAAPEEFEADLVTVTAIDDEATVENQEVLSEDLKRQQEKRKRKFF